mmetsp:Transcript_19047/g.34457  ORF Transcript_19047/g.34457 Transcript_19047/m.34457 type:complete len:211 (-) Transcript_19047:495-1127(-)
MMRRPSLQVSLWHKAQAKQQSKAGTQQQAQVKKCCRTFLWMTMMPRILFLGMMKLLSSSRPYGQCTREQTAQWRTLRPHLLSLTTLTRRQTGTSLTLTLCCLGRGAVSSSLLRRCKLALQRQMKAMLAKILAAVRRMSRMRIQRAVLLQPSRTRLIRTSHKQRTLQGLPLPWRSAPSLQSRKQHHPSPASLLPFRMVPQQNSMVLQTRRC